jgi:hypothetical protein
MISKLMKLKEAAVFTPPLLGLKTLARLWVGAGLTSA